MAATGIATASVPACGDAATKAVGSRAKVPGATAVRITLQWFRRRLRSRRPWRPPGPRPPRLQPRRFRSGSLRSGLCRQRGPRFRPRAATMVVAGTATRGVAANVASGARLRRGRLLVRRPRRRAGAASRTIAAAARRATGAPTSRVLRGHQRSPGGGPLRRRLGHRGQRQQRRDHGERHRSTAVMRGAAPRTSSSNVSGSATSSNRIRVQRPGSGGSRATRPSPAAPQHDRRR